MAKLHLLSFILSNSCSGDISVCVGEACWPTDTAIMRAAASMATILEINEQWAMWLEDVKVECLFNLIYNSGQKEETVIHTPCRSAAFDWLLYSNSQAWGGFLLDWEELADSQCSLPDPILKQGPTGAEITGALFQLGWSIVSLLAFYHGAIVTDLWSAGGKTGHSVRVETLHLSVLCNFDLLLVKITGNNSI